MSAIRSATRFIVASMLALVLANSFGTAQAQSKLSKADSRKLREGFAEALAGDERAGKKLVSEAKDWGKEHDFDSLLEALRAGPLLPKGAPKPRGKGRNAERFEEFGSVTTDFTFTAGKDTFRYAVDVPKSYDEEVPAPVILDPGHGAAAQSSQEEKAGYLGYYRHRATAAGIENALVVRTEIIEQIGAGGLMGERPEDEVSAVFDAFFRDLCSRFAVDLDRVWVTGISQTGFWAWQLGLTRADRFAGIAPMGAVTWGTNGCLPNLLALATHVLHGDADAICPVEQPRKTAQELTALGAEVVYEEIAGGQHDYSTWQHLDKALAWLAERPRDPYPKKIARNLQTLQQPWCYWIRIDALKKEGTGKAGRPPTATLAAEIEGQAIRITSEGVERLTLCLARELVDLSLPITVLWNEKQVFEGLPERDFARTVELALEKADWRGTSEAALELKR